MTDRALHRLPAGLIAILAGLLLLLAASCGGSDTQPNTQADKPAPGKADLIGQLTQTGGQHVVSVAGPGLPGAEVALINTFNGKVTGRATTNNLGSFEFRGVPSGDNYLVRIEFQSSEDLDGNGEPDSIELFVPVVLADQSVIEMLQEIGIADADGDGAMDAVEVDVMVKDDHGNVQQNSSQYRRRDGEVRHDANHNGRFDDDPPVADSDTDGLADAASPDQVPAEGELLEIQLRGLIAEMSAESITIGGLTLLITESTEFRIDGDPAEWESFSTGMYVEVEGFSDGGEWIALEVRSLEDSGGEESETREVQGAIEDLTETTIVVGGVSFEHNDDTEWKLNGEDATAADFSLGMFVSVEGHADGMGGWIADEVKTNDDEFDQRKVILGVIQDLTDTLIMVDWVEFAIDEDTDWSLKANRPASRDEFSIGQRVQVKGITDGQGGWIAREVRDKSFGQGEHGETFELEGVIDEVGDSTITVKGVEFAFDGSTEWKLDGDDAAAADFAPGIEVRIKAHADGHNGWIADEIEGTTPEQEETIEVSGELQELTESSLTVEGVLLAFDDGTVWTINDLFAGPGDFATGMEVAAIGHADGMGGWIADEVNAYSEVFDEVLELSGEIEELTESSIMVNGTAFRILPGTRWIIDESEVSQGEFGIGTYVIIQGFADGMGGWFAQNVEMMEPPLMTLIHVSGSIDALNEDSVEVAGFILGFDESTEWTFNGLPSSPDEFSVGMYITAAAESNGTGGWYASSVASEPEAPFEMLDASGMLAEINESYIVIGDVMLTIDPAIEWLIDGEPAEADDFSVGMEIRAEALADELGNWIVYLVESPIPGL